MTDRKANRIKVLQRILEYPGLQVLIGTELYADLETLIKADLVPEPILSLATVRKLGALSVEQEHAVNVAEFLEQQKRDYASRPASQLAEELLRRDENAFREGRMMSDGRMATNLLRELVRHLLQRADRVQLQGLTTAARKGLPALTQALERGDGGMPGLIEGVLEALGAEPADLRQLRLHGSMLGSGKISEEVVKEFAQLVDGTLAHTEDTTAGSARVGEEIKEFRERIVPKGDLPS